LRESLNHKGLALKPDLSNNTVMDKRARALIYFLLKPEDQKSQFHGDFYKVFVSLWAADEILMRLHIGVNQQPPKIAHSISSHHLNCFRKHMPHRKSSPRRRFIQIRSQSPLLHNAKIRFETGWSSLDGGNKLLL
jgi:hypothetical protein